MIILERSTESIVVGRNSELPIGVFMFNSWDKTLDTVLVNKSANDTETALLRKIAYQYAEKIKKGSSSTNLFPGILDVFQKSFDECRLEPEKEAVHERYFTNNLGKFIKNAYDSPKEAVDEIIKQVKDASGVSVSISRSEDNIKNIVYTVSIEGKSDTKFTFWNSDSWPREKTGTGNLHIVPGYHPSSPSQGRKLCGLLINGDTDGFMKSKVICSVYSPKEARRKEKNFGTSWSLMVHPCKATGKSFQFTLRGNYHSTKELVDDAVQLILAALGTHPDGHYVGISGGFHPIYDFPENIAGRTGRELPRKNLYGSEKHCMWTYDVLKEENELEKAYIPDWFTNENWVKFFEGQKGIFPKC